MPVAKNELSQGVVADFASVGELRAGLEAKSRFDPVDLYHRDGSELLGEVESRIASLAGVTPDSLLSYNSGMSAVTDAIDVGLHVAEADGLPVLACPGDTYSQTKRYIEHFLRDKRARVVYFDSGDPEDVDRVIEEHKADVVVVETIANYLNVPVLNTDALLEQTREAGRRMTTVLDNTLPLSTGLPLGEMIGEEDRVIVVESGTKSYTFNQALLGVGYTKNPELHDWLRRYRRTRGSLPGPEHLLRIDELLPTEHEEFDSRNQQLFSNTGRIACILAEAKTEKGAHLTISYPAVPAHPNHDFYTQHFPRGGAPILYIVSNKVDQYELAEELWQHEGVRDQAKLGQSFGFDHTRIVADENVPAVRIAGGADTDAQRLGQDLAEALYR